MPTATCKLTRDLSEIVGKVATIGLKFCEQPAEDRITDAELRGGGTEHALEWARSGHKITNRKLAVFAGLDPVADRERIEQLGLNLSTRPKGRNERRELVRAIAERPRRASARLRIFLRSEVARPDDRLRMRS